MTIRVLIVDDHALMREGLQAVLTKEPSIEVVGEASDGLAACSAVKELRPQVVVMDIGMSRMNGIEATREILAEHPEARVVALSVHSDKRYIVNMIEVGARGYVIKSDASAELLQAIQTVARGETYLSPKVSGAIVECIAAPGTSGRSAYSELGGREREVLQLLAEGQTSRSIAHLLHISPRTVETHRRNIMKKLDLRSVAELTKYAIREGITSVER